MKHLRTVAQAKRREAKMMKRRTGMPAHLRSIADRIGWQVRAKRSALRGD